MNPSFQACFVVLGLLTVSCRSPSLPPAQAMRAPQAVLIDADTANEIDDLFAIVRVFFAPELNVVGLTGAQYVTQEGAPSDSAAKSHRLNLKLLEALGRSDVATAAGADLPLPDPRTPQDSPAARLIVQKARQASAEAPLVVFTLGAVTNVASALLLAPDIAPKIRLWSIMLKHKDDRWNRSEFNALNDQNAVDVLLSTPGLDLHVMTATASASFTFTRDEVGARLENRGALGAFLTSYWDDYVQVITWHNKEWNEKRAWVMWDVTLIEALLDPTSATFRTLAAPTLMDGSPSRQSVKVFTQIDAPKMATSYWRAVTGT